MKLLIFQRPAFLLYLLTLTLSRGYVLTLQMPGMRVGPESNRVHPQ